MGLEYVEDEVRELFLYIVNNSEIYKGYIEPITNSLAKKAKKGVYDSDKAILAWKRVADIGARMYVKEFCSANTKWFLIFSVADRKECASRLEESEWESIQYKLNNKE